MLEFQKILIQAARNFHEPEYKSQKSENYILIILTLGRELLGCYKKITTRQKKKKKKAKTKRTILPVSDNTVTLLQDNKQPTAEGAR